MPEMRKDRYMDIKAEIDQLKKSLDPLEITETTSIEKDLPIFEIDREGHFTHIPDIMEEITGFTRDELSLLTLENVVFAGDRSKVRSSIDALKNGSRMIISEVDIFSEMTGSHPMEMIMVPKLEDGEITGAWGAVKDIINRKDLECKLKATKEVQEISQQFLQDFVSLMAREIRQPLTSILLTLEMCDSGFFGDVNNQQQDKLMQLIEQVERLKTILNEALAASKDIGKDIKLETKMFPVKKMVGEVIKDKDEGLKEKGLTISYNSRDDDIKISADRKMITQVINDLIDSSIELSPVGGEISIESFQREEELQFSISDAGEGISERDVRALFDKIHVDQDKEMGSFREGLNLYMAKKVVETHGGRIWCESFPGLGSNFIFTLPVNREDPEYGR